MNALIVGGAGFVGGYLAEHLKKNEYYNVAVTKMKGTDFRHGDYKIYDMDLLGTEEINSVLSDFNPDIIFNLAAQSSVALSWSNPNLTVDVNINGCINLLEAAKKLKKRPRIILIGSGEEYGAVGDNIPIAENTPLRPMNIYAASKACQAMMGSIYVQAYGMDIIITRSFNHTGPGQPPHFVVSDFCKQTVEIEKGLKPAVMSVGNLSAKRDFTDVRDIVKAYSLLALKGKPGQVYNVGSGKAIVVREILDRVVSMSSANIKIETDETKIRPIDVPVIEADISKLKRDTGWEPVIPLERTIADTMAYWRDALL